MFCLIYSDNKDDITSIEFSINDSFFVSKSKTKNYLVKYLF